MTRKRFSIEDKNGTTRYHLHGVAIRSNAGLCELLDIDTQLPPGSGTYVKAIIGVGPGECVVETYDIS